MNDMKCPVCKRSTRPTDNEIIEHLAKEIDRYVEVLIERTKELDRTRKALEIAWDGLEKIGSGDIIEHSVVGHENDNKIFIANKALNESKTALEQKD